MAQTSAALSETSFNISFDQRSRSVRVQGKSEEILKKKLADVREVIPSHSNNDIICVLEHFNQNVEQTIQAFIENDAKDILTQWHSSAGANKALGKKKKKKKPSKEVNNKLTVSTSSVNTTSVSAPSAITTSVSTTSVNTTSLSTESSDRNSAVTDHHDEALEQRQNGGRIHRPPSVTAESPPPAEDSVSVVDSLPTDHTETTSESLKSSDLHQIQQALPSNITAEVHASTPPLASAKSTLPTTDRAMAPGGKKTGSKRPPKSGSSVSKQTSRPEALSLDVSQATHDQTTNGSNSSAAFSKKPHGGLERCYKDLQRQTASLQRHKLLITEQMNKSLKELNKTFEQLREELTSREAVLLYELNKEKTEGENWLEKRHQMALELRHKLDKVPSMKESEVINLRADIKHFVSERRVDEDIASRKRFTCDMETFKSQIRSFGLVIPIKAAYTTRHPSVSSTASVVLSPDDVSSPMSPQPPAPENELNANGNGRQTDKHGVTSAGEQTEAVSSPVTGAKVIKQSESLTLYEQSNPEEQTSTGSFASRSWSRGRGQSQRGRGQGVRGRGPRGQVPHELGPRGQPSSRGQGPRYQYPRSQRSNPGTRGRGDASRVQGAGTSYQPVEEQVAVKKNRNVRQYQRSEERQQQTEKGHKRPDTDAMSQGDGKQNRRYDGESARKERRNQRTPSPRKRDHRSQGQSQIRGHPAQSISQNKNEQRTNSDDKADKGDEVTVRGNSEGNNETSLGLANQKLVETVCEKEVKDSSTDTDLEKPSPANSSPEGLTNGQVASEGRTEASVDKVKPTNQKSVVVSVKEQTDEMLNTEHDHVVNDDGVLAGGQLNHSVSSEVSVDSREASTTCNGVVDETSTKKATVSVEKLNEVMRATISVDDALPQRKSHPKRRERTANVSGRGDEASTNSVCDVSS